MPLFGILFILLLLGMLRAEALQGRDFIHVAYALVINGDSKVSCSGGVKLGAVLLGLVF